MAFAGAEEPHLPGTRMGDTQRRDGGVVAPVGADDEVPCTEMQVELLAGSNLQDAMFGLGPESRRNEVCTAYTVVAEAGIRPGGPRRSGRRRWCAGSVMLEGVDDLQPTRCRSSGRARK